MAALLFPKPSKKAKVRTWLKRSRKKPKARARFIEHGKDPTKQYRRRFTDYQVMLRAEICRQQRLRNRTPAEMAFAELLDSHRILYEVEKIIQNGDKWVLLDVFIKAAKLCIEIDGTFHKDQADYDTDRSDSLFRRHGIRTIRFSNGDVLKRSEEVMQTVLYAIL
jgi:very-short-patch-repair endonuclease